MSRPRRTPPPATSPRPPRERWHCPPQYVGPRWLAPCPDIPCPGHPINAAHRAAALALAWTEGATSWDDLGHLDTRGRARPTGTTNPWPTP